MTLSLVYCIQYSICHFSLLKGREADGVFLDMEDFVRTSIRDFKYRDSVLLKTLMKNIGAVTPV